MIMSGSKAAVIQHIQMLDIHGTRLYDIVYLHEGESHPRQARIGLESVYPNPQVGDRISVSYLMNVATGMTKA